MADTRVGTALASRAIRGAYLIFILSLDGGWHFRCFYVGVDQGPRICADAKLTVHQIARRRHGLLEVQT